MAFRVGLVGAGEQVVCQERRVLRPGDFVRVEAAVDVNECLAFGRQPPRIAFRQAGGCARRSAISR
jgi:hypothetical protein